jgi:hypothetical protein
MSTRHLGVNLPRRQELATTDPCSAACLLHEGGDMTGCPSLCISYIWDSGVKWDFSFLTTRYKLSGFSAAFSHRKAGYSFTTTGDLQRLRKSQHAEGVFPTNAEDHLPFVV